MGFNESCEAGVRLRPVASPMRPNSYHRLVSYTKHLAAEAKQGRHHEALDLFAQMFASPDLALDPFVFSLALKSAAVLRLPLTVRAVHAHAVKSGLLHDPYVASSLVDSYGKCASLVHARKLFDDCTQRNAVVWNALISLYCRSGDVPSALRLFELMDVPPTASSYNSVIAAIAEFGGGSGSSRAIELCRKMQVAGIKPNLITTLALFPACVGTGTLNSIKEIHGFALRNHIQPNSQFDSGLVEAYGRGGCLPYARCVFDEMEERDVVSWSSMVSVYAFHGHANRAMSVFKEMELDNIRPDGIMFLSVLKACSHAGLADDALKYFDIMTKVYGLDAGSDHYSCLVDVLSRAGWLKEAYEVIRGMPMKATPKAWGALLGACRSYGEVRLAEIAAKVLFEIEPENAGNFVLLASIYAGAGKFEEAERVKMVMEGRGVSLNPGGSWVVPHRS
ncbi:putative pentatricopeptide repeat-containing protein At1g03510 [Musa acuminata AAA Group]|uniref:putative pentatricopeptide repeat-containing protein At1g03510 n=1 Tax=Musa acuminata AAA Group TaxID=214697 RepID=UPI0031D8D7A3